MQNMAKYQIDKLKFFTGFFVPYVNKKARNKIRLLKQKYKNKSERTKERNKVNIAIGSYDSVNIDDPISFPLENSFSSVRPRSRFQVVEA